MSYKDRLISQYYSTHYKHNMPNNLEEWRTVIDRIDLNFGKILSEIARDSPILDIPCGVGYLEHYLLKKGFTNIHAVDLSEEMIQVAKSVLYERGFDYVDNITFIISDAFDYLKNEKNRYSVIAMIDFLEHLEKNKVIEVLDLAYHALQPGGFLLIRAINAENPTWGRFFYHDFTHETPFTLDTLSQCLSITGFDTIKIGYEILPYTRKFSIMIKQKVRLGGLYLLGKFLGVPPQAFTENLVAIGRKQ